MYSLRGLSAAHSYNRVAQIACDCLLALDDVEVGAVERRERVVEALDSACQLLEGVVEELEFYGSVDALRSLSPVVEAAVEVCLSSDKKDVINLLKKVCRVLRVVKEGILKGEVVDVDLDEARRLLRAISEVSISRSRRLLHPRGVFRW